MFTRAHVTKKCEKVENLFFILVYYPQATYIIVVVVSVRSHDVDIYTFNAAVFRGKVVII